MKTLTLLDTGLRWHACRGCQLTFQKWMERTLPEILHAGEETFLSLKNSSNIQERKLDQILEMLEELTSSLKPPDLSAAMNNACPGIRLPEFVEIYRN